MNCANCDSPLNAGAKFCPSCGTAVSGTAGSAATVASPPPVVTAPPPPVATAPPPPASYGPGPGGFAGQPSYVYVQQPTRTNGLAIAAMVLGILWIYWIGSVLAVIFGYVAKSQIDQSGGQQGGRGMAIAGIVLGWIGVATLALVIIVAAANSN